MNFWQKLKKPIFILAPMDGVTDTVFRQIVTFSGKPDVFFTEFVPVDALLSSGKERVLRTLKFDDSERPIIAQIWGTDPDKFYETAKILVKMKFDGIDINMGCPQHCAVKKGACSALINNPNLAQEIIKATISGAGDLPVSVKTRIGFNKIITSEWIKVLLQTEISALTVHLRTASEMSKPKAHWEEIKKVVQLKKKLNSKVIIIGNGDIKSVAEGKEKCQRYDLDGIMIGRGIFENIFIFNKKVDPLEITTSQKIDLFIKHLELFKKTYPQGKDFNIMKKFVKCYINNFDGASLLREELMQTKNIIQLIKITENSLS